MTIKQHLATHHPEVSSVHVTVNEVCLEDHPPRGITWTYSESSSLGQNVMGHYCHGKTPLKTAHFELLIPIDETLRSKTNHHKGKLPTYWCDDGRAILRRYECKIIFHEMGLVNKSTL